MDIQALINAMSSMSERERGNYHLTLGGAVKRLRDMPADKPVMFEDGTAPEDPGSYRGYYSDLAFEATADARTVADFLKLCEESTGQTFEGYKGGDYTMHEKTPLWRAPYGCCGDAIVDLREEADRVVLVTKNVDGE